MVITLEIGMGDISAIFLGTEESLNILVATCVAGMRRL